MHQIPCSGCGRKFDADVSNLYEVARDHILCSSCYFSFQKGQGGREESRKLFLTIVVLLTCLSVVVALWLFNRKPAPESSESETVVAAAPVDPRYAKSETFGAVMPGHTLKSPNIEKAAIRGHVDDVRAFLARSPELANYRDHNGDSVLAWAVFADQYEVVEVLLNSGANVNASSNDGTTPLHTACSVRVARLLLTNGARINARSDDGTTPVGFARACGRDAVVRYLISEGGY